MSQTEYDAIVIGAGVAGENVADRVVAAGLTALIIESELVGGTCSYWACMPSKALLRTGSALRAAQNVEGARQAVTRELDIAATLKRRDTFTHDWNDESQVDWLEKTGIDLVRGHGVITAERQVTVGDTVYTARHAVVVATGSLPLLPDIPGLAGVDPWTSRDATSAKTIPDSLAIVGGGVVGVEMATAYASFGCAVTLIARSGLLGGQEPFAGELVADALRKQGVKLLIGVSPASASRSDGTVELTLDDGSTVAASEVLMATGRTARTSELGLENIGLTPGDWLDTDDTLRVKNIDWLYGVGDVNHRSLLTHQGKYQARAAGDAIGVRAQGTALDDKSWGTHVATADHEAVPQVIFSDPEVAAVGLTAQAAREAGYDIRSVDYNLGWVAGASLLADGYEGKARMVIDESRGVVLGATFVGQDVSELLHAATIAVVGEVPLDRLWHAVPAYPTMSEVWLRLLEEYGRPLR